MMTQNSQENNSAVDVTPLETVENARQQQTNTPAPPQPPAEKQTSTNTQTTTCLPNTKKQQSAVDVTTGDGGNDGQRQNTSTTHANTVTPARTVKVERPGQHVISEVKPGQLYRHDSGHI